VKELVGFKANYLWFPVGTGSLLHSFFSTITYHLEPKGPRSKYPLIVGDLYQGKLLLKDINAAIHEVEEIRMLLKEIPPEKVIWDLEDLDKAPPWGNDISDEITDLSNYFVTSDGVDLFEKLLSALVKAHEFEFDLEIVSL